MLPDKPALAGVKSQIAGWNIGIGGVKFHTNAKDPYSPSITASVSIGPPGRAKFNVQAAGTLNIKTYCQEDGPSMVKVTPSLALKLGDVPAWMQEVTLPNMANHYIDQALHTPGGPPGRYSIPYPSFLSGKDPKAPPPSPAAMGPGIIDRIKQNWEGIKMAVRTVLAGKFQGNRAACDSVPAPQAARGGGGSCHLCMAEPKTPAHPTAALPDISMLGHLTGNVNFRVNPSKDAHILKVLNRCTTFTVLERETRGTDNFWTKIQLGKQVGYVARQFVQTGPAYCEKAR